MKTTTASGPLGFPLTDRQAFALEAVLKSLPRDNVFRYRHSVITKGTSELLNGERSDVSWISAEEPDRTNEVVLAAGMNASQFRLNPIVTMQHAYYLPPVGKSLWQKVVRDGSHQGVKAKTQYPEKPADWPAGKDWPADIAFALISAGLLRGKSIGFLPTKVHAPNKDERDKMLWKSVDTVIDEWLLLEYACTFLPAQQNAIVEAVSKAQLTVPAEYLKAMGLDPDLLQPATVAPAAENPPTVSRFTPIEEIEKAFLQRVEATDFRALAKKATQDALDRAHGRV